MRSEFAQAMCDIYKKAGPFIFITGDLGYAALEKVEEVFEDKFINAGVAEQNMISLAAGLAYSGFIPWIYSIAPFTVLRPYEQLRNDICLHRLPAKIVGNGGGYGYGIMGATHHTLEDIAVMRVLPSMKVYVPFVSADVKEAVQQMASDPFPNYLRLNAAPNLDFAVESFRPWRKIKAGKKIIVVGTGPVIANIFQLPDQSLVEDIEVWAISEFPIKEIPGSLIASLKNKKKIATIEEHIGECGLNEALAVHLLRQTNFTFTYKNIYAKGYPTGKYGSQRWHQEESGLAGEGLKQFLVELSRE